MLALLVALVSVVVGLVKVEVAVSALLVLISQMNSIADTNCSKFSESKQTVVMYINIKLTNIASNGLFSHLAAPHVVDGPVDEVVAVVDVGD